MAVTKTLLAMLGLGLVANTSLAMHAAVKTVTVTETVTVTAKLAPPTSQAVDAPTTATTAAAAPTLPAGIPLGCWLEGSTPGRALAEAFMQDDGNMDPHACARFCKGHRFFGVEYGSQCFCGGALPPRGVAFPVPASQCRVPCTGSGGGETCGGHGTLAIYESFTYSGEVPAPRSDIVYTPAGCWAEPSDGSNALDGFLVADPAMDSKLCAHICGLSEYLYFGLEYGNECYCDGKVSAKAARIDGKKCDMPCAGNSTEACGSRMVFNLYKGAYKNGTTAASRTSGV